ncbi:membrane lipoprotein lipid attachment site-containing protein [Peribacillus simplex]|uniref:Membrane lipoprotein lipid attachment site-containing protein n=1 Tax=Peribacillus simplex TaxID=1478 RepID=A0AAW7IFJ6_9BACI|nr:membrane lipoprotein lipid attachment site-containing protein [Peribacillus simplex]MDM5454310.1 membrane lipoprotein lipid attachment site-containing protein [Peribacillus simplex]
MKQVIFYILLILFLAGCSNVSDNTGLEKSIFSIVEDKNNSEIRINSLTTFDWEKAFIFTPYSTQEGIEEQLGVNFNDPSDIDWRDDIYLLVFLNDDKVVQYIEVDRQGADFTIEEKKHLTPSDDLITIERY